MIRHLRLTTVGLLAFIVMAVPAASALAAGSDSAKGTLTVETESKPASIELAHAYLVSGPDTFDPKKITRRIVFTKTDERATIEACSDVSCATLSSSDGMTVELGDEPTASWWAHVHPMQYSGMSQEGDLKLSADTDKRVAGTFKIGTSGVKTSVEFDAPLVKTFPLTH
ncbi:MAG TPA: hypothetical protein VFE67_14605 [Rudaea sp.]|jgi:hypothetical protein|nr:hypothetical protein [Rudaea sp.]